MKKKELTLSKFHFTLNDQTYLIFEDKKIKVSKIRTDNSPIEKSIEDEILKFKEKNKVKTK